MAKRKVPRDQVREYQAMSETYCEKHGVNLVQTGGHCGPCERGVDAPSSKERVARPAGDIPTFDSQAECARWFAMRDAWLVYARELERELALKDALIKAMEDCIGPREGQTFAQCAEELIVTEVQHERCSAGETECRHSAAKAKAVNGGLDSIVCECGTTLTAQKSGADPFSDLPREDA